MLVTLFKDRLMHTNSNKQKIIYKNEKYKIHYEGFVFSHKRQLERFKELRNLEEQNLIKNLHVKEEFNLGTLKALNGKPLRYFVDFVYFDIKKQETIYEDVKKHLDEFAFCKRQLFEQFKGIKIKII